MSEIQSDERCELIKAEIENSMSKDAGLDKNFREGFWSGTIWADENPNYPPEFEAARLSMNYLKLAQALAMAKEALKKIAKDFGTDHCDGNTLIAQEAIEALRKATRE